MVRLFTSAKEQGTSSQGSNFMVIDIGMTTELMLISEWPHLFLFTTAQAPQFTSSNTGANYWIGMLCGFF